MFRYDHLEKKRENNVKKSREDFTIFRAKQKVSNVAILSRLFRVCKSRLSGVVSGTEQKS